MKKCPKCQSKGGYYIKLVATYEQYFTFDGQGNYASDIKTVRGGKVMFCQDCDKKIGRWDDKANCFLPFS